MSIVNSLHEKNPLSVVEHGASMVGEVIDELEEKLPIIDAVIDNLDNNLPIIKEIGQIIDVVTVVLPVAEQVVDVIEYGAQKVQDDSKLTIIYQFIQQIFKCIFTFRNTKVIKALC